MAPRAAKRTRAPKLTGRFTIRVTPEAEQQILELAAAAQRNPSDWLRIEVVNPALARFAGKQGPPAVAGKASVGNGGTR